MTTRLVHEQYIADLDLTNEPDIRNHRIRLSPSRATITYHRNHDTPGTGNAVHANVSGQSRRSDETLGAQQSCNFFTGRMPAEVAAIVDAHRPAGWGGDRATEVERLRAQATAAHEDALAAALMGVRYQEAWRSARRRARLSAYIAPQRAAELEQLRAQVTAVRKLADECPWDADGLATAQRIRDALDAAAQTH